MKKKNVMIIFTVAIVGLVYLGIMVWVYGGRQTTSGLIVVSKLGGYECQAKQCSFVDLEELNTDNKNFKVYQRNSLVDTYELNYGKNWNFFKDGEWQALYGDFIAVEESLNAEILPFSYDEMNYTDREALLSILEEENISDITNLDEAEVVVLDLDNNGTEDRIGVFSNQTEENATDKYFSVAYLVLNGKTIKIYADYTTEKYDIPFYNVFSILKIDGEKEARIIINQGYYDNNGENSVSMWQLNGRKIEEVA